MITTLYRFYDLDGHLLYVGISARPWERFMQHRSSKPWWWDEGEEGETRWELLLDLEVEARELIAPRRHAMPIPADVLAGVISYVHYRYRSAEVRTSPGNSGKHGMRIPNNGRRARRLE